jgi:hypothetical protein
MRRPSHAEKKKRAAETRRLLETLAPATLAAVHAMDVGDEALVFAPDGSLFILFREAEATFRARELEGVDAATAVAMRWREEERQAEAVS